MFINHEFKHLSFIFKTFKEIKRNKTMKKSLAEKKHLNEFFKSNEKNFESSGVKTPQ